MLDLPKPEVDVLQSQLICVLAGYCHHLRCHVHPDDTPRITHLPGSQEAVEPSTCSEVDHGFARSKVRDSLGIPATQPHVRTLRGRCHLVGRVSHSEGNEFWG